MRTSALLFLNAVPAVFGLGLLLWVFAKAKRAKQSQNRLIQSLDSGASDTWFRINVSRPSFFSRRMKLLGFEAKGLLVNSPGRVRVLAEFRSGETLDRTFEKPDLGLQWIGNKGLASSNMHWFSIGPADQGLVLSADTGFNALQSREATADLCRIVDPRFQLPDIAKADFALEKNPASLAVIVGFFALLAFAFFDGVILNKNELIEYGQANWGIPVSAVLGLPLYWWLSRRQVPSRESLTLSILFGAAIVAAYIPAIKRADQFLAEGGTTSVAYRLGPHAVLEPIQPGPPTIDFSRRHEYWRQFDEGSTHYFDLTHGPLGLWQLDHTNLDDKLRVFYETADRKERRPR